MWHRGKAHTNTPPHTHTCTAANPTGRACSDKDGADFNTISYGAGYSGEGRWFDLRRHGIRTWKEALAFPRVSLCEKWLLGLLMLLSKAHWTSASESCARACVCEKERGSLCGVEALSPAAVVTQLCLVYISSDTSGSKHDSPHVDAPLNASVRELDYVCLCTCMQICNCCFKNLFSLLCFS